MSIINTNINNTTKVSTLYIAQYLSRMLLNIRVTNYEIYDATCTNDCTCGSAKN